MRTRAEFVVPDNTQARSLSPSTFKDDTSLPCGLSIFVQPGIIGLFLRPQFEEIETEPRGRALSSHSKDRLDPRAANPGTRHQPDRSGHRGGRSGRYEFDFAGTRARFRERSWELEAPSQPLERFLGSGDPRFPRPRGTPPETRARSPICAYPCPEAWGLIHAVVPTRAILARFVTTHLVMKAILLRALSTGGGARTRTGNTRLMKRRPF
jgi:hypothetical protein